MTAFVGLWPLAGWAGGDLSVSGTYRSYPLSGYVEAVAGYGAVLYGTEGSPFSGYFRAALEGDSAYVYNSGTAKVEFFPLAILGGRAGIEHVHNDRDYSAFDCETYRCLGSFRRAFVEGELTLGAGPMFIQGRIRRERWTQPDPLAGDFIDPTSGLVLRSDGQSQTVAQAFLGVKFSEAWGFMGGLRYAHAEESISRMPFGLLRWHSGDFQISAGGGTFESPLKTREAMVLASLQWNIWPSVALK